MHSGKCLRDTCPTPIAIFDDHWFSLLSIVGWSINDLAKRAFSLSTSVSFVRIYTAYIRRRAQWARCAASPKICSISCLFGSAPRWALSPTGSREGEEQVAQILDPCQWKCVGLSCGKSRRFQGLSCFCSSSLLLMGNKWDFGCALEGCVNVYCSFGFILVPRPLPTDDKDWLNSQQAGRRLASVCNSMMRSCSQYILFWVVEKICPFMDLGRLCSSQIRAGKNILPKQ